MRTLLTSFSLFLTILFAGACKSTGCCDACAKAQEVVASVAGQNPDVTRLTVHCSGTGGGMKACASTSADKLGKPSDPEDVKAVQSGETVVLDEAGALDVTVPIVAKDGKWTAACGVTLKPAAGMSRDQAVAKAKGIAKAVEAGLGDCCAGGCCCSK